jgi:hypothetical protein
VVRPPVEEHERALADERGVRVVVRRADALVTLREVVLALLPLLDAVVGHGAHVDHREALAVQARVEVGEHDPRRRAHLLVGEVRVRAAVVVDADAVHVGVRRDDELVPQPRAGQRRVVVAVEQLLVQVLERAVLVEVAVHLRLEIAHVALRRVVLVTAR